MEPTRKMRAALGFRAHSGWAALVVIAGSLGSPGVIERRRVDLVGAGAPNQPYHAAAKVSPDEAERIVRACRDRARNLAQQAISAVLDHLRPQGCDVAGCGIVLASGRPLPSLATTLASHVLIHTAEGELFREALSCAAESLGLPLTRVPAQELRATASSQLHLSTQELVETLKEMGRSIGRSWRQDDKEAALVAWLALAAASVGQF